MQYAVADKLRVPKHYSCDCILSQRKMQLQLARYSKYYAAATMLTIQQLFKVKALAVTRRSAFEQFLSFTRQRLLKRCKIWVILLQFNQQDIELHIKQKHKLTQTEGLEIAYLLKKNTSNDLDLNG